MLYSTKHTNKVRPYASTHMKILHTLPLKCFVTNRQDVVGFATLVSCLLCLFSLLVDAIHLVCGYHAHLDKVISPSELVLSWGFFSPLQAVDCPFGSCSNGKKKKKTTGILLSFMEKLVYQRLLLLTISPICCHLNRGSKWVLHIFFGQHQFAIFYFPAYLWVWIMSLAPR